MFRLRQSTRRRICRAAFLAACLLPLCALGVWGGYRRTAHHVHDYERSLQISSGLGVSIAAVEHPRPGIVRLRGLTLSDAETGRPLVECQDVELRHSAWRHTSECLARGVTLRQDELSQCYSLIERLLRREQRASACDVVVAFADVTILDGDEQRTMARIDGSIHADRDLAEAKFDLLPAAGFDSSPSDAEQPIALHLVRNRQDEQPSTSIELHTGQHAVPAKWLAALYGDMPALADSRFSGSIWLRIADGNYDVAVRGALTQLDLATLLTRNFGFAAAGAVDLLVESAHFSAGRLQSCNAQLVGGAGRISPALLSAAGMALGCSTSAYDNPLQVLPETIPYEQLGIALSIDAEGRFSIAGRCRERAGAMLVGADRQPLLMQPVKTPPSAVALVKMFAGKGGSTVPATKQAALIMKWLQLPSSSVTPPGVPATAVRVPPPRDPQRTDTDRRLK